MMTYKVNSLKNHVNLSKCYFFYTYLIRQSLLSLHMTKSDFGPPKKDGEFLFFDFSDTNLVNLLKFSKLSPPKY